MTAGQAPTYFISDLHLEISRPALIAAFKEFLFTTASDAKAIYILGDFFDAWIGDDDNSALVADIKSALTQRSASGTPIYFTHGNRDFLIGEKFAQQANVILLPEEQVIDLYGTFALLLHGDQLCTDDVDYLAFRRKVRNPAWQKKMLAYPLWLRKLIAAYMRHKSRKAHQQKSDEIMDVAEETVSATFKHHKVCKMIHGHTHRPAKHTHVIDGKPSERFVLGDWGDTGWYLKADADEIQLIEFQISAT